MRNPLFGALMVLLAVAPVWAGPAPVADLADRIDALVARGEASPDQAELYWLYAVRAPERLPAGLRAGPAGVRAARAAAAASEREPFALRCGTPVLRHVRARLGRLPPALRAEAVELLGRASAGRGAAFRTAAGKTGAPALANRLVTENFSIEWGPDLTNEDGSTPVVRDQFGDPDIPDVVERWAAYFEAAYAAEVGEMGYTHPAVEANLIPVYIGNSDANESLEDIGSGTYAFTQPDGVPYIVVNNDLSFVPANGEGTSGLAKIHGAMKITAAHELFHVFHFLYEPDAWIPTEDDWWFECSSTWMEDEVFDDVNDYYQYFNQAFRRQGWADFLDEGLPVRSSDLNYVTRAYGSVIFAKYLSEHVGGRLAMFDVWDRIRFDGQRILDALDAFATANGFAGLPDLFLGFVGATAVMDYEEGANYGGVPAATGLSVQDSVSAGTPSYLGAVYASESSAAGLRLSLTGVPAEGRWGLALVRAPVAGPPVFLGLVEAGGGEISVAGAGTATRFWAGVTYLDSDQAAGGWTLAGATTEPGDVSGPGAVTGLSGTAAPGGFDLVWAQPAAADLAGFVVDWGTGSRTLYGPVSRLSVRQLGAGDYAVSVTPYDRVGNLGEAATVSVSVSDPATPTPTPLPEVVAFVEEDPPTQPATGGGGGGGGCFLTILGF